MGAAPEPSSDHGATVAAMRHLTRSMVWVVALVAAFAIAVGVRGHVDLRAALVVAFLCFACELIDSGLGMGYGTILTPTLLWIGYSPAEIVPTILLSELLSGFSAAFFHHHIDNVDLAPGGRDVGPASILASASVLGVTGGVFVAMRLPGEVLAVGIGCVILLSGLFVVLSTGRAIVYRRWRMMLLAVVASFNKAVSGGGYGPLVTSGQILSGVRGRASVGITSFAEAFTCLFAVALFLGQGGAIHFDLFLPMALGALLSVPFAVFAVRQANEDHLKIVIGVLTLCMGVVTIVKGLRVLG